MTFYSIVHRWCKTYKPMLDNEIAGNKRFYLTDSPAGVVEMAKGIANTFSPFVMMESGVEGYFDGGRIYRNYPIYFFERAEDMADGEAAAVAKEKAWGHAQNFITWLRQRHQKDSPKGEYGRIDLENNIEFQPVGPIENGWYGVLIQLTRQELLDLCVKENFYIDENG